jgi:DHA1 family tetracycline resistance protein-like MFS transporter
VNRAGLGFIFATIFLDVVGIGIIIPIMPMLLVEFVGGALSDAAYWVGVGLATYTATQFLCAPLLGALSDRYGRKPILVAALLMDTLGYLGMGLAGSLGFFLLARAVGGAGGASLAVATTYINDVSTPEKRAQNFGLVGAAFGLGFIAGPALGGLLGGVDLRFPFYAAAAVAGLNTLYGLFFLPESHPQDKRRAFQWADTNPLGWVAAVRKFPMVSSLAVATFFSGLGMMCLHSNWVLYTNYKFQWTPAQVGASLAVVGLCSAVVQGGLIRVLMPRVGERRAIVYGLALGAVAMSAYALATQGWMMYVILVFASLGGLAGPAIQAQVARVVPPAEMGLIQGALTSLNSVTGVIGPLLGNAVFGYFTAPGVPVKVPGAAFFLGTILTVAALVQTVRVFRRFPERGESPPGEAPLAQAE